MSIPILISIIVICVAIMVYLSVHLAYTQYRFKLSKRDNHKLERDIQGLEGEVKRMSIQREDVQTWITDGVQGIFDMPLAQFTIANSSDVINMKDLQYDTGIPYDEYKLKEQ